MELREYLTPECLEPPKPAEELRIVDLSDLEKDKWNMYCGLRATVLNALVHVIDHFGVIDVRVHGVRSTIVTLHIGYLSLSRRELAMRYPEGAAILIKSPYFLGEESSFMPALLVGHPNAVIIECYFPGLYSQVDNPDDLMNRGRAQLKLQRYSQAVELFDAATKLLKNDDWRLIEAKYIAAVALFQDNRFEESLSRAKHIPVEWKYSHQSMELLGRTQMALRSYFEACWSLFFATKLVEDGPDKDKYAETFAKASRLNLHSQTGVFDPLNPESLDDEMAEYIGPVEIKLGKYGRGVFVTRGVKQGELLMVCNPIAHSEDLDSLPETDQQDDVLVSRIVRACSVSGRVLAQVNSMQSDTDEPETLPPMEYFQTSGTFKDPDTSSIDINRIKEVLAHNRSVFVNTFMKRVQGLWGLVSFINHACSSNVSVMVVRNVVFVIASKCLSAGTELFRNYHEGWKRQRSPMPCAELDSKLICSRCALVAEEPWRDLAWEYVDAFDMSGRIPGWVADTLEAELAEREERLSSAQFAELRPLRAAFAWSYTASLYCDVPTAVDVIADILVYSSGETFGLCHLIFSSAWMGMDRTKKRTVAPETAKETDTEQAPETAKESDTKQAPETAKESDTEQAPETTGEDQNGVIPKESDEMVTELAPETTGEEQNEMTPKESDAQALDSSALWFGTINPAWLRKREGRMDGDTDPLLALMSYYYKAFLATFGQHNEHLIIFQTLSPQFGG